VAGAAGCAAAGAEATGGGAGWSPGASDPPMPNAVVLATATIPTMAGTANRSGMTFMPS
jgi:hypothetical protein